MEISEAIKRSSIFNTLEEEELDEILKITRKKRFQKSAESHSGKLAANIPGAPPGFLDTTRGLIYASPSL